MKARRDMKYQELAMEVARQLQSRFSPNAATIKRCVDLLILKEFLQELEDDRVGYLA